MQYHLPLKIFYICFRTQSVKLPSVLARAPTSIPANVTVAPRPVPPRTLSLSHTLLLSPLSLSLSRLSLFLSLTLSLTVHLDPHQRHRRPAPSALPSRRVFD